MNDSTTERGIEASGLVQNGPEDATQPLLDSTKIQELNQIVQGGIFISADDNDKSSNDAVTLDGPFDTSEVATSDRTTNPSASPSTPKRVQESQSSVASQSDSHTNDTSPTDMNSLRYNVSPRQVRRYSCSQLLPINFDLRMSQPKTKLSNSRPLTPALVARLREDLTSPADHTIAGGCADDSRVESQSPSQMHHSLALIRKQNTVMKRQLQNQQRLMDSVIESREMEMDRVNGDRARELKKGRNASSPEVSEVKKQLKAVIATRDKAFKSIDRLEEQLSITQDELEVKVKELKQTKGNRTMAHEDVQATPHVNEVHPRTRSFGMKSASPAYNARVKDTAEAKHPEMVAKLNSQSEDQIAETKREKARADGLLEERDEALSKQESLSEEISALTLRWEDEHTKVGQLRYHLQDDPAKTEALDDQLGKKDEAYKALQKKYGDTLAENAELQSRTSHIQETADWKVASLEKKLDREHEMMLDIARSRDAYVKSHEDVLSLCKGKVIDQEWVTEADEQWKIASDEIRVLNTHLKTSKAREAQLTEEVLLEKAKVESAQQATRAKIDKISELEYEGRQKGRDIERLEFQAQEHDHLIAGKDAEIQCANENARSEIDKMSATLMTVMDKGSLMLVREKDQDLEELRNVLSQNSETIFELEQQIYVLQDTHKWDTNVAQVANETHQANTSRMVAAEEQVAQLIKQLSNGENPTNESLWEQWRQSDAARIEIRQGFEEVTARLEECKALGVDFCAYFDMLGATFDMKLVPGGELHDHHQRLFRRAERIFQLSDEDERDPVAFYPNPIGEVDESSESRDSSQILDVEPATTPPGSPTEQSANEAQLADESPIARSKRLIAEKEKELGILQLEDGTWDIKLHFPPLEAQHLEFLTSGGSAQEVVDQESQRSVVARREEREDRLRRLLGISSNPKDTITADAHGHDGDAAEVKLGSDLEGPVDAKAVLRNEDVEAEATPRLPHDITDANKKLRNILDELSQESLDHDSAAIDAEASPRPPPGLATTHDTMAQNLEQLYQVVPAPSTEPLHTHDFPQYSPRPNGIEAVLQSSLEKLLSNRKPKAISTVPDETIASQTGDSRPSSPAGDISPFSADCLWDSPDYDIDAWHARTQARIEKERNSPPLDPSLVYTDSDPEVRAAAVTHDTTLESASNSGGDGLEDPEADIHAWFARYQNGTYAPQLEIAVAQADVEGEEASTEEVSASVSGQDLEEVAEELDEEEGGLYLGSDGPVDARDPNTSNDRRLALYRPPMNMEQVLGPGEVWDDEDDVEVIC